MLAEHLGKTWQEIKDLPYEEFVYWNAYFKVRKEERGNKEDSE